MLLNTIIHLFAVLQYISGPVWRGRGPVGSVVPRSPSAPRRRAPSPRRAVRAVGVPMGVLVVLVVVVVTMAALRGDGGRRTRHVQALRAAAEP